MKLRVLLVDDEVLALARLRAAFAELDDAVVVGEARTLQQALDVSVRTTPDVLIVDIHMPGGNGLDLARAIAGENAPEIIFATAHDSYAAEAFDLDASDYILKPIRADRLKAALARARRRREARNAGRRIDQLETVVSELNKRVAPTDGYENELWAPRPGGAARIPIANIIWIEAARNYVLIHTDRRSYIARETMASLGERLDPGIMLRVHRSAFVHRDCIDSIERTGRDDLHLQLANGTIVRVGASYRAELLERTHASVPARPSHARQPS